MEKLENLIDELKKKKEFKNSFGPVLNKVKKNPDLYSDLIKETSFLNHQQKDTPIGQRFYHLWFEENKIPSCNYCENDCYFSKYERFSTEKTKKDSNYYRHCGNLKCIIEDFKSSGNGGKGYGALVYKISSEQALKNQLIEKTIFLDTHYDNISSSQRFYHVFFEKFEIEKCHCGNPKKFSFLEKFSETGKNRETNYNETCGSKECIRKIGIENTKKGIFEKYGVETIWEIPGYREKYENSNILKYGTPYMMGSDYFKGKTKEKIEKNWGGLHPTKHKSVQEKKVKTTLEKTGFNHRLKNPAEYEKYTKKSYQYKDYIFPSGKKIRVQGYENYAIDILLDSYKEEDILVGEIEIYSIIGNIEYTLNNKNHIYYPDIYIKSENKIIEVKSKYTYENKIEENKQKRKFSIQKGISFEFWIMEKNKIINVF